MLKATPSFKNLGSERKVCPQAVACCWLEVELDSTFVSYWREWSLCCLQRGFNNFNH